jgi:hypothetical protein
MENLLKNNAGKIIIISGEGERGNSEVYTGKRTQRAIKSRLTKERCHGDRWARAVIYSGENEYGQFGIDLETGDYEIFC